MATAAPQLLAPPEAYAPVDVALPESTIAAIALLDECASVSPAGLAPRLLRARDHLAQDLLAYYFGPPKPTSEAHATSLIRSAGQELARASQALTHAAEALKFAGKGQQANATIQAARRAREASEGLGA